MFMIIQFQIDLKKEKFRNLLISKSKLLENVCYILYKLHYYYTKYISVKCIFNNIPLLKMLITSNFLYIYKEKNY